MRSAPHRERSAEGGRAGIEGGENGGSEVAGWEVTSTDAAAAARLAGPCARQPPRSRLYLVPAPTALGGYCPPLRRCKQPTRQSWSLGAPHLRYDDACTAVPGVPLVTVTVTRQPRSGGGRPPRAGVAAVRGDAGAGKGGEVIGSPGGAALAAGDPPPPLPVSLAVPTAAFIFFCTPGLPFRRPVAGVGEWEPTRGSPAAGRSPAV